MRPSASINVHPADHQPSDLHTHEFDVICIGSGWAGRVLAARIVKAGHSAVIVESELMGGDCPFWACVPSKVLLQSPLTLEQTKGVGGAKERLADPNADVDVDGTFARRDIVVGNWDDSQLLVPMIESTGVYMARGVGKLTGVKSVEVTPFQGKAVNLTARMAVAICTGSEPTLPDVPGLKEAVPWTPRDATSSKIVPKHLIIMGAGAVGSEMATAYLKYGAQVTLISSGPEILSAVDPEAAALVRASLEGAGADVRLSAKAIKVQRKTPESIVVTLSTGDEIAGSELLVAAGRIANLRHLGLDAVGVLSNERFLGVDETLCVKTGSERWLWAVGDVNGRAKLTHMSKYHATVAANAILVEAGELKSDDKTGGQEWSRDSAAADRSVVPQVTFTDPQVASVGLSHSAARASGRKIREVKASLLSPGYMIHSDDVVKDGFAKWLIDEEQHVLVGATFVGTHVAELLHASTVAIAGQVPLDRLMHAVPSFPTISWVYYNLMDAAGL